MLDERVKPLIFGNDVKGSSRIGGDGLAQVINEREIECILAAGSKTNQLQGGSVHQQFFDQRYIEFCLPCAQKQCKTDIFAFEDRWVDSGDVLEVNEDMV